MNIESKWVPGAALVMMLLVGWPSLAEADAIDCRTMFTSAAANRVYGMAAGSLLAAIPAFDRGRGYLRVQGGTGTSRTPDADGPPEFSPMFGGRSGGEWGRWGYDVAWLAHATPDAPCWGNYTHFSIAASRRVLSRGRHQLRFLGGPQLSFVDVPPYGGGVKVGLLHRWRPSDVVTFTNRLSYLPTLFPGGFDNHPVRASLEFAFPTDSPWHLTTSAHGGLNRNGRIPRVGADDVESVDWYARGHFGFMVGVRTSQTTASPSDDR